MKQVKNTITALTLAQIIQIITKHMQNIKREYKKCYILHTFTIQKIPLDTRVKQVCIRRS